MARELDQDELIDRWTLVDDESGRDANAEDADGPAVLVTIRSEPGNVNLNTMLTEIGKLEAVRAVALPDGVFVDIAPKVVSGWRARAAVEAPSHLREHAPEVTLTLLAAMLYCREREITDTLVELLISTVHRINARAEVKVTKELAEPDWADVLTAEDRRGPPRCYQQTPAQHELTGVRLGIPYIQPVIR